MLSMLGLSSARQYATAELYRYALRPSKNPNSSPEPPLCAQRKRDRTSRQSLLPALVKAFLHRLPAQASMGFSMPTWPLQVAVSVFRHWVCRASWDSIAASNGLLLMTDNVSFSERGARIVADEVLFLPLVAFRFPPDVPARFPAVCSCFARSYRHLLEFRAGGETKAMPCGACAARNKAGQSCCQRPELVLIDQAAAQSAAPAAATQEPTKRRSSCGVAPPPPPLV